MKIKACLLNQLDELNQIIPVPKIILNFFVPQRVKINRVRNLK